MSGPLFGMPHGISDDVEEAFAAMQTWAGKQDGNGKWVNPTTDASFLRVDGAGNSLTIGNSPAARAGYTIVGSTMFLNIYLAGASLTITTATNLVYLRIPDGYVVAGAFTNGVVTQGRPHYNACYIVNNGTSGVGLFTAQPTTPFVYAQFMSGANFVTSNDFTILGSIALEVKRS